MPVHDELADVVVTCVHDALPFAEPVTEFRLELRSVSIVDDEEDLNAV